MLKRSLALAGAAALASSLFGAPIAADIIAYRTEDGVFAYTDDRAKVPARYAADAVTVRNSDLQAYPRLTIEDTASAREVSARLEKRLNYLRQANAATANERAVAAGASAPRGGVVTIPTATADRTPSASRLAKERTADPPSIDFAADPDGGPIVVEPLLTRQGNRSATRTSTVIKQGDKVLAIMKGRSNHIDVSSDFHDEDTLEQR